MALCTVCRIFCIRFCNAKCALHDRQNPQVLIQSVHTARPRAYEACTFTKIAPTTPKRTRYPGNSMFHIKKYMQIHNNYHMAVKMI